MSLNKIIARVEETIKEAPPGIEIAAVVRTTDHIEMRDNSGIRERTTHVLFEKTVAFMDAVFQTDAPPVVEIRTLSQIVDQVRDGGRPDYEELRYAVCALEMLASMDSQALTRLAKAQQNSEKPVLAASPLFQAQESLRRWKGALTIHPKVAIGWDNDPDNPAFRDRRKAAQALWKKVAEKNAEQRPDKR